MNRQNNQYNCSWLAQQSGLKQVDCTQFRPPALNEPCRSRSRGTSVEARWQERRQDATRRWSTSSRCSGKTWPKTGRRRLPVLPALPTPLQARLCSGTKICRAISIFHPRQRLAARSARCSATRWSPGRRHRRRAFQICLRHRCCCCCRRRCRILPIRPDSDFGYAEKVSAFPASWRWRSSRWSRSAAGEASISLRDPPRRRPSRR